MNTPQLTPTGLEAIGQALAGLENCLLHFGANMPGEDRRTRTANLERARSALSALAPTPSPTPPQPTPKPPPGARLYEVTLYYSAVKLVRADSEEEAVDIAGDRTEDMDIDFYSMPVADSGSYYDIEDVTDDPDFEGETACNDEE